MPQYQGVWTLEAQAQAQSNQQWVTDPNFKNTTLLLQADGTGSGSQNNTFLDGSTNNFFITRNGNTTQGSFSPFSQAPGFWSNYFNGGSTLSAASNSALNILAYDTFECWVNMSVLGSNDLIAGRDGNYWIGYNHTSISGTANKFVFSIWNGSSWQAVSSTTTPTVGVWYHILGVKDNTTLRFYVNGVQENTATFSGTPVTTGTFYVASNNNTENLEGYVSNLRLITGASNAVFPYAGLTTGAAFTPQTTPLTAVSSTQLLTCQTNRFVDNSTNAFALTAVSVPSVQAFGPFAPALQWTPDVVGGSGYFDGSDYLSFSGMNVGSNTFTFETWAYFNSTGNYQTLINGGFRLLAFSGNTTTIGTDNWGVGGGSNFTVPALAANTWYHIAYVKNGTTGRLYLNGVESSTGGVSDTNTYGSGATTYFIGATSGPQYYMGGYMCGTRMVIGTAVYTSAFTPPTAPPTAVANTALLLNYTNAGIYDGKMGNVLETVGNAQVSTNPVKYGSGSMYFPPTNGNYCVSPPNQPNFIYGTGNFTVEAWLYPIAFTNVASGAFGYGLSGGAVDWGFEIDTSGNALWVDTNGVRFYASVSLRAGVWTHVAVVRTNTGTTMYYNGVSVGTYSTINNISGTSGARLYVGTGAQVPGSRQFVGFIDDFRVTKDARYFTTFTPPQQALPRQ